MFLNYIGKPSIYLPVCMMIWGTISILTGITTRLVFILSPNTCAEINNLLPYSFTGALLTRFFLGFVGPFISLDRCDRIELYLFRLKLHFFPVLCSSCPNGTSVRNWDYAQPCCIVGVWSVTASDLLSHLVFLTIWRVKWDVLLGGQWRFRLISSKLLKLEWSQMALLHWRLLDCILRICCHIHTSRLPCYFYVAITLGTAPSWEETWRGCWCWW